jgi:hypothetical protein
MTIQKYGRFFAVYDEKAALVCVCVYKKGAAEVVRRLNRHSGWEQKAAVSISNQSRWVGRPRRKMNEGEFSDRSSAHFTALATSPVVLEFVLE